MIKRDGPPGYSAGQWGTVAEFSLPADVGCQHQAAGQVAKVLARVRVPDPVLLEASGAVIRTLEKELSRTGDDRARRAFTIRVLAGPAQLLEMLENGPGHRGAPAPQKGWGFFLIGATTADAGSGDEGGRVVVSLYLYQEGHPG